MGSSTPTEMGAEQPEGEAGLTGEVVLLESTFARLTASQFGYLSGYARFRFFTLHQSAAATESIF